MLPYGTTVERIGLGPRASRRGSSAPASAPVGGRADLPRRLAGQPRLRGRSTTGRCRVCTCATGRSRSASGARCSGARRAPRLEIVPGLLAATLAEAGVPVAAEADSGLATLAGVDRNGVVRIADPDACETGCGAGLSVVRARPGDLGPLVEALASRRPADRDGRRLARRSGAAAGRGRRPRVRRQPDLGLDPDRRGRDHHRRRATRCSTGSGSSRRTRSTAPRSGPTGERDPAAVADRSEAPRHPPGPRVCRPCCRSVIWIGLCGLAAAIWRGRGARLGLRLLAPAACLGPGPAAGGGGAATPRRSPRACCSASARSRSRRRGRRWRAASSALAVACGVTVAAYAIDVVAGSPLTALSVLGPEPGRRGRASSGSATSSRRCSPP